MSRNALIVAIVVGAALAALIVLRLSGDDAGKRGGRGGPAAVEIAAVESGSLELRRTFTGSLEARSRFVVSAHTTGRVERLLVELADPVTQGQIIAELDDADETQGVAEAASELSVARANLANAESAFEIAHRELDRIKGLHERGVASEAELDAARARHLSYTTQIKVAKAQLGRATAAHRRSRIRSGYTRVIASWNGDDEQRFVAQRHVAAGDTVSPNDPLITVVDLDPLDAVIHVTEREYARLAPGQLATITTDAYPERTFPGAVRRIAPVFRESSRQARMEIEVANPDRLLKPGMFIRAQIILDRVEGATIVPRTALTTRGGATGLFVVNEAGDAVSWRPVIVGISDGGRVEVRGEGIRGRVVTLGQQLVDDGSAITIPDRERKSEADGGEGA